MKTIRRYSRLLLLASMLLCSVPALCTHTAQHTVTQQVQEEDLFDFDKLDRDVAATGIPLDSAPETDPGMVEVTLRRVGMPIFLLIIRCIEAVSAVAKQLYALTIAKFQL